ncbi:type IV pilin protein [Chondromyces crocatus]|uniref:Fimbrial protein pilA n=1 Tax=Chondromyces crocatus TaxID=52 RepID=A0A0K1EJK5_CHOCO|nr:prepilin-type N-terminal cleavage/methylation domain-containing protein [Chondromyces crocatus]AKT41051.1 fimbrial protein pilA [Chondromyces crocatus]
MLSTTQRRRICARGFTLVELLVVVAMIGVLAAIALVGYRRYMNSAGSAEARAVMQGIRGSEEAYRAEMLTYLGCSGCASATGCAPGGGSLTDWYPMNSPGQQKHHWVNPGHGDYQCWRLLNVTTDGPVRFGYSVVAGLAGSISVGGIGMTNAPSFPDTSEPWYVIAARGDRDGDGDPALLITSSLNGEIYAEKDSE